MVNLFILPFFFYKWISFIKPSNITTYRLHTNRKGETFGHYPVLFSKNIAVRSLTFRNVEKHIIMTFSQTLSCHWNQHILRFHGSTVSYSSGFVNENHCILRLHHNKAKITSGKQRQLIPFKTASLIIYCIGICTFCLSLHYTCWCDSNTITRTLSTVRRNWKTVACRSNLFFLTHTLCILTTTVSLPLDFALWWMYIRKGFVRNGHPQTLKPKRDSGDH